MSIAATGIRAVASDGCSDLVEAQALQRVVERAGESR